MIRSRSEQKFRHVVLKVPIFSTEVQILKLEFPGMQWEKAKNPQQGNKDIF